MLKKPHYLKEWRKYRGNPTQERVAQAIGKDRTIVTKLESFKVEYTQEHLHLLANYYNCEPADLLSPPPDAPTADIVDLMRHLKGPKRDAAVAMLMGLLKSDGTGG